MAQFNITPTSMSPGNSGGNFTVTIYSSGHSGEGGNHWSSQDNCTFASINDPDGGGGASGNIRNINVNPNPLGSPQRTGNFLFYLTDTGSSGEYTATLSITQAAGATASVTVTSPTGSDDWEAGTTHNITWNYTNGMDDNVKIELFKASFLVLTLTESVDITVGTYSWEVPYNIQGDTDYRIKITAIGYEVSDYSSYFTISLHDWGDDLPTVDPGEYGIVIKNDYQRVVIDGFFENYAVAEEIDVNLAESLGNTNSGITVDFANSYSVPPLIGARLNTTGTGDSCTDGCTHGSPYFAGFRGYTKDGSGNYTGFKAAYGNTGNRHGVVWTAFVIVPSSVLPNPAEADSFGLEVRTAGDELAFSSSFRYFLFHDQIAYPLGESHDGDQAGDAWFDSRYNGAPQQGGSQPTHVWDPQYSGWAGVGGEAYVSADSWHNSAHLNIYPTTTEAGGITFVNGTSITMDGTPDTFHGSMWTNQLGIDDNHVQSIPTIAHYDTQANVVFIINSTNKSYNYGYNWAWRTNQNTFLYSLNSVYWSMPVVVRRSDTSISLQSVANNQSVNLSNQAWYHYVNSWHNNGHTNAYSNSLFIPYGEVSK